MLTIPRDQATKRKVFAFIESHDIHKWVIGRETGKKGYEHWQIRFESSQFEKDGDPNGFEIIKDWFREAHVEADASDNWEYEKKEGRYFAWDDNPEKLRQRYGNFNGKQEWCLYLASKTTDRQILLWYDPKGSSGKSWFCGAMWERRRAYYCPPFLPTAKEIVQFVASGYAGEEYVILDMPRDVKWTTSLYAGIEAIKDGLIAEPRYHAGTQNIRGAKLIVLANTKPKLDRLSTDRWVVYEG